MRLLHRLGWRTIPLPRVAKFLAAGVALPLKSLVLTFDDGDADLDWAVRPVLRRYGFTASAFVVTGYLGGRSDWERAEELRGRPLLSEAQLRAMADEGWDIGSHTASHPNLSAIDGEAMEREVRGARERLEEVLQRAVPSFCYPSGDYDARSRAAVKAAGHTVAVTTVRGCVRSGADPLLLPRIGVSHRAGPLGLLWRIRAARAGPPRSAR
jgi:peptidoglycan/xylan/chitin deacetylase (PgdA/CDA1 family)